MTLQITEANNTSAGADTSCTNFNYSGSKHHHVTEYVIIVVVIVWIVFIFACVMCCNRCAYRRRLRVCAVE